MLLALKIKDEIGDKAGVAGAYTNIGVIYYVIGNRKKAIEYWEIISLPIYPASEISRKFDS